MQNLHSENIEKINEESEEDLELNELINLKQKYNSNDLNKLFKNLYKAALVKKTAVSNFKKARDEVLSRLKKMNKLKLANNKKETLSRTRAESCISLSNKMLIDLKMMINNFIH